MRRAWFAFFFVSGACSLVYQVVWLRLAMAAFGVTTAMVSIVIATFMAGLALGSWAAGRLARRAAVSVALPLRLYGLAELVIALSGVVVPWGLEAGRRALSGATGLAWGSTGHHAAGALCVAVVLLPFCTAMGATFPLAMWSIRRTRPGASVRSFSFLYLANVLGATAGTLLSAFVAIELLGLRGTVRAAASLNGVLAAAALVLSARLREHEPGPGTGSEPSATGTTRGTAVRALLFTTGLASMGMEVVWVRQFTPYLGTLVYAFAVILAVYLSATFAGSAAYRWWLARSGARHAPPGWIGPLLATSGLLPLVCTDPRWPGSLHLALGAVRVAFGVAPLCATLGFLTPWLLDRWSEGRPERVGGAYALNIAGCILGPLLAGFVLLPWMGERWSLVSLSALMAGSASWALPAGGGASRPARSRLPWGAVAAAAVALALGTRDFASTFARREVRRDHAATVIATGEGPARRLLVNGQGMTVLTPITKMMAHLPLASLEAPPRRALVVCFGMGTSFRSLASWGVATTAVELVPSVPGLFGYFHADGPGLLRKPGVRVVIDDGRRFLERTREAFDVITVDPPPPVEAAGSSLLYTREFYRVARSRLQPGGIVQQWLPQGDAVVVASFTRALVESFRHVRAFGSVEDWGTHFLASDAPIPDRDPAVLASRMPEAARRDLTEWGPAATPESMFAIVLGRERAVADLLAEAADTPALTDDRPFNEYYLLRRWRGRWSTSRAASRAGGGIQGGTR
jgi:spermidine synthase